MKFINLFVQLTFQVVYPFHLVLPMIDCLLVDACQSEIKIYFISNLDTIKAMIL